MAMTFAERMAALNKKPAIIPLVETAGAAHATSPTPVPAKKTFGVSSAAILEPIAPAVVEPPKKEYEVGNIILLANEANKIVPKEKTEGEQLIETDMPAEAIRIKQRIAEMENFDGISLRTEMDELKKLIKASPEACLFLLPEELGLMVRALRKQTDNRVAVDMGAARKPSSKKQVEIKLTADELSAALDDL